MTIAKRREIAKFFSGAEAFHAFSSAVILISGLDITIFGIQLTPIWYVVSMTVHILIAVALASYGWGIFGHRAQAGRASD